MPVTIRPIRVVHVLYSFGEIGGLENGVVNILNNLSQDTFLHIVCSLTGLGPIRERVTSNNVHYYHLHKREGNDLTIPLRLYSIFRKESVDVVHLRNWPTMVEGYIAAKFAHVNKVIYSEHGRHFEDVWGRRFFYTAVKKHIFNKVDMLLSVSNELAREMKRLYALKRSVSVIVNGVDCNRFAPMARAKVRKSFGWREDDKIIGTVGRLDKGKNLDELILDLLALGEKKYKLVLVGDGPERTMLELLIRQHECKGRILLMGHQDDIPSLLNCFDVFALPSASEGLSNVILEAMACGLPVVAYNIGGNTELITNKKGGYLIELGDRDGFVRAIANIMKKDAVRAEMGDFNRSCVLSNFSIARMVDCYDDIYRL